MNQVTHFLWVDTYFWQPPVLQQTTNALLYFLVSLVVAERENEFQLLLY